MTLQTAWSFNPFALYLGSQFKPAVTPTILLESLSSNWVWHQPSCWEVASSNQLWHHLSCWEVPNSNQLWHQPSCWGCRVQTEFDTSRSAGRCPVQTSCDTTYPVGRCPIQTSCGTNHPAGVAEFKLSLTPAVLLGGAQFKLGLTPTTCWEVPSSDQLWHYPFGRCPIHTSCDTNHPAGVAQFKLSLTPAVLGGAQFKLGLTPTTCLEVPSSDQLCDTSHLAGRSPLHTSCDIKHPAGRCPVHTNLYRPLCWEVPSSNQLWHQQSCQEVPSSNRLRHLIIMPGIAQFQSTLPPISLPSFRCSPQTLLANARMSLIGHN